MHQGSPSRNQIRPRWGRVRAQNIEGTVKLSNKLTNPPSSYSPMMSWGFYRRLEVGGSYSHVLCFVGFLFPLGFFFPVRPPKNMKAPNHLPLSRFWDLWGYMIAFKWIKFNVGSDPGASQTQPLAFNHEAVFRHSIYPRNRGNNSTQLSRSDRILMLMFIKHLFLHWEICTSILKMTFSPYHRGLKCRAGQVHGSR